MGMFDNLYYEGEEYQTKDTPNQALDKYKIETDQESGHQYLWVEEYDSEWHKDSEALFGGYLKQFNERWVRCDDFEGLIRFYKQTEDKKWKEYNALFMDGKILRIKEVEEK